MLLSDPPTSFVCNCILEYFNLNDNLLSGFVVVVVVDVGIAAVYVGVDVRVANNVCCMFVIAPVQQ